MADKRPPSAVQLLILAAMLFSGLATLSGLDARTGVVLAFSVALLVGGVAVARFAVVMLVRTRHREYGRSNGITCLLHREPR